jgi:hypothetical protein
MEGQPIVDMSGASHTIALAPRENRYDPHAGRGNTVIATPDE